MIIRGGRVVAVGYGLLGLILQVGDVGVGVGGGVQGGIENVGGIGGVRSGVDYELIAAIVRHGVAFLPESRYFCGPAGAGEGVVGFDRNVIMF